MRACWAATILVLVQPSPAFGATCRGTSVVPRVLVPTHRHLRKSPCVRQPFVEISGSIAFSSLWFLSRKLCPIFVCQFKGSLHFVSPFRQMRHPSGASNAVLYLPEPRISERYVPVHSIGEDRSSVSFKSQFSASQDKAHNRNIATKIHEEMTKLSDGVDASPTTPRRWVWA